MALFITSLNSGSNGNCFYIGNDHEAILVDAGISCRETEKRMRWLGLSMEKVKAIFISHEHSDHINGLPVLSRKYQLPVFITHHTLQQSPIVVEKHLIQPFKAKKPVTVGNLSVLPFKKSHDACDPHSFVISGNGVRVGVFTDIGYGCKEVIAHFTQCHAVFLESNYCEQMLMNGDYPYHLKRRIHSDHGHLSNAQALELFRNNRGGALKHLILSHLSRNNNSPELVERMFREHAGPVSISIASRYQETPVYCVEGGNSSYNQRTVMHAPTHVQLSLFHEK
jgi:phosphoribosyl 1,2-cyclic phosphodiesterase